jgi:glycosyltransferase involved in cell wall biosynthesis
MNREKRKFLFLEPFYGGSHREFADGWREYSRHELQLHTLPPRFWKWRMRGAALHFARGIGDLNEYSGLVVTDLMSLADLKALWGKDCPPTLLYVHENQLTYPLAQGEQLDLHYGFTNITTALCAERVLFNSYSHFRAFFEELPRFVRRMPEYRPRWVTEEIRRKSDVLHPGCRFYPDERIDLPAAGEAPLIVWNHRWEFDKNPDLFFSALEQVAEAGGSFRLALLGENYQMIPKAFIAARRRFHRSIQQYGYLPSREQYLSWLRRGGVVVSTADQENFGISVVEAVRHGCFPLLPRKLSYPELIPEELHEDVLFGNREELVHKLFRLLEDLRQGNSRVLEKMERLALSMNRFSWANLIDRYDGELERLGRMGNG